jgi:hypothetical protein
VKSSNKNLKRFLLTITGACIGTCVGISGYASQAQAAQLKNLVTNGDFSAIDPLPNPNDPTRANPFITGWYNSTQNDTYYTTYLENYTASNALENSKSVRFGASADFTYISQNLNTEEGQKYRLTYYLATIDEEPSNIFRVFAGGDLIKEQVNVLFQGFEKYTVDFTANSANTELRFASRQRAAWYNLDDVSVVAIDDDGQQSTSVPEPSVIAGIAVLGLMGLRVKKNRLAKS